MPPLPFLPRMHLVPIASCIYSPRIPLVPPPLPSSEWKPSVPPPLPPPRHSPPQPNGIPVVVAAAEGRAFIALWPLRAHPPSRAASVARVGDAARTALDDRVEKPADALRCSSQFPFVGGLRSPAAPSPRASAPVWRPRWQLTTLLSSASRVSLHSFFCFCPPHHLHAARPAAGCSGCCGGGQRCPRRKAPAPPPGDRPPRGLLLFIHIYTPVLSPAGPLAPSPTHRRGPVGSAVRCVHPHYAHSTPRASSKHAPCAQPRTVAHCG